MYSRESVWEYLLGRSKRQAANSHRVYLDGSDQLGRNSVFYKLRANGKEFHFNLTLNTDLLANDFMVEYWGNNGSVRRNKELWDCHYSGFSTGPTHSNAAISNCVGLVSGALMFCGGSYSVAWQCRFRVIDGVQSGLKTNENAVLNTLNVSQTTAAIL